MSKRNLIILAVVAALVALIAFFVPRNGAQTDAAASSSGKKFFPDLVVNDVAEISVSGADSTAAADPTGANPTQSKKILTFVVKKEGDTWGAAEKGGYPVDVGKVKQLVLGLADMTAVAEMTKKADGYKKLGVEDLTDADAESKRVTVKDKSGKVVADVLIGKPKTTRNFGGKQEVYVRRVGDAQAFTVSGQANVAVDAASWLDREIAKVEGARMRKVTTTQTDGTQLTVSKAAPEEQNFTVEGLPEGKELMWPGVANQIPSALQYLNLEDVRKNDGFDMSGATITEFDAFDGLVVTVKTLEKDGKTWMTLNAAFDPSQVKEVASVEPPPPAAGEKKEGDAATPAEPKKPARKTPDEVKAEVEAFNKKVGPWVYAVPGYNAANLRKRMDDLLKKPEPPPGAAGAGADAHGDGELGSELPIELGGAPPVPTPPSKPVEDKPAQPPSNPPESKPAEPPTKPGGGR
jgi:hypothetical protein